MGKEFAIFRVLVFSKVGKNLESAFLCVSLRPLHTDESRGLWDCFAQKFDFLAFGNFQILTSNSAWIELFKCLNVIL